MSKVFISYRREDAAGYAQAIYSQLERDLRRDQIFMDVDTIEPGVDFVTHIEQAVSECDVVIALIGKRWKGERENAPPRVLDPQDFVHLEIASALSRDIRVIPVLVDGASMPSVDGLPPSLQPLIRRNALELSNTRFRFDLKRISQAVQRALAPTSVPKRFNWRWRPSWKWYGGLSFIIITLAIATNLWITSTNEKTIVATRKDQPPSVGKVPPLEKEQPGETAPRVEKAEPTREAQTVALLGRAKAAEDKLRLTSSAGDNATRYYLEVLQLDPSNTDAQRGLKRIGEQYVAWADQAIGQRQIDNAAANLAKAASVTPDHPALGELGTRLEELKARETDRLRAEAERKKQAELKRLEEERTARDRLAAGRVFRDRLKIGGEGPEMVVVPPGTFHIGDVQGSGKSDERPVHPVKIQKPFAIGRYEVPFEEYDRFARATRRILPKDEGWGRGRRPVIHVSWDDATKYSEWLSEQTGKRYRLPSEAEWEYAARSGGKEEKWAGTSDEKQLANYAVFRQRKTEPVGSKKPNGIGLYDMSGNVWEWVEDCWHENYEGAPDVGQAWLQQSRGDCSRRVVRGGSWKDSQNLRSSVRFGEKPFGAFTRGFRLAQDLP